MTYRSSRRGRQIGFNYGSNYDGWGQGRSNYDREWGSASNWNWGSFGGFGYGMEDDDKDLYIKSHDNYFTPKAEDFTFRLPSNLTNTKANRDLVKELSRFFYYRMIGEKDYFDEKFSDPGKLSESEMAGFEVKKNLYEGLWDKFVPGVSPLEQALSIIGQIAEKKSKTKKEEIMMSDLDSSGVHFHEEIYMDPEYNELLDTNNFGKSFKVDIMNLISLIRDLGSQFKVEKEVEEKIVPNSHIMAKKMMRDYSQLYNIDLYQKLMPTFPLRLLTKNLVVDVPVEKTEHKQKIIILLDYSGSMDRSDKQKWVLAILVDRLRYVMKGEAEVFFSYFEADPDRMRFHHLHNRETVLNFWSTFSTSPSGGETRLGDMVNRIKSDIEMGILGNLKVDLRQESPEILAINDGQDSVKTNKFIYKTNAITVVDGPNDELKNLCIQNGGKYVHASGKGVKTFSIEGTQILTV